ncbi:MAG: VOC family protein [Alphaproteobacteria bacterium]|nr:VOC family protein [Alphaproteobacteria bacterium]
MGDETDRPRAKSRLTGAEAELFVADFQAACAFYTAKLGFAVAFAYGNPPFYGQVKRDGACLNLRYVCDPVYVGDIREREDLLAAGINVDDVKQLYLEFQAAGVPFHQPLRLEPWGVRTFIVKDPDGNLVLFAGGEE